MSKIYIIVAIVSIVLTWEFLKYLNRVADRAYLAHAKRARESLSSKIRCEIYDADARKVSRQKFDEKLKNCNGFLWQTNDYERNACIARCTMSCSICVCSKKNQAKLKRKKPATKARKGKKRAKKNG